MRTFTFGRVRVQWFDLAVPAGRGICRDRAAHYPFACVDEMLMHMNLNSTSESTQGAGSTARWTTPAGTIVGYRDGLVLRASGIRYARAGRFERPTPEPTSPVDIDATRPAPSCPQPRVEAMERIFNLAGREPEPDEDCLRLSVTLPADITADEQLPVMVWIHGGAYIIGAGDSAIYDAAPMALEQRIIHVSVTYRLGLLGYLGDGARRPANLGLLDQIEALRWVRANIAAFRGDPEAVTVYGQSAGGDAVLHLMIARGAEGLFRRAISQSPPVGTIPNREKTASAMMSVASTVTTETSTEQVIAVQKRAMRRAGRHVIGGGMHFGPQYGCDPLPAEEDLEEAWSSAAERVDLLIGSTDREEALFFDERVLSSWARPWVRRVLRWYAERIFGRGARSFADRHRRAGGKGYLYSLSWGTPGHRFRGAHAIELPLLFGTPQSWRGAELMTGVDEQDFLRQGQELRRIWAEFARTGSVGTTAVPGLIEIRELTTR